MLVPAGKRRADGGETRKQYLTVGLLWELHPEHAPEMHRIETVSFEPAVAETLDLWCFQKTCTMVICLVTVRRIR